MLVDSAKLLKEKIGTTTYDDFNIFKETVEKVLKEQKITLSASEKNMILNAVSWSDETAQKLIKKISKISGDKLEKLCENFGCKENELCDFGYYPTGKKDEFVEYESDTDLRDSENIPLKDDIYQYFLKEVKPHVEEAWINLDSTKIGYEISFNKYFYTHKPLRSLEEVGKDIVELENASDGLIKEILGL
jgi:type I restriction enzyme M protein